MLFFTSRIDACPPVKKCGFLKSAHTSARGVSRHRMDEMPCVLSVVWWPVYTSYDLALKAAREFQVVPSDT